jgi:glycerophosphoryl diester phosphodiesterase
VDRAARLNLPGKPKPYVMAHRGNQTAFPENTLSAFRQAVIDGADMIETDLHLSSDGVFVCIHDATVDRTTDGSGAVASTPFERLRRLNAAASRPDLPAERIPSLGEFVEAVPSGIGLALELKAEAFFDPGVCGKLASELHALEAYGRTVILSFKPGHLQAMRGAAPGLPRGWITLTRLWPVVGYEMTGPFWPILVLNPLFVWRAHRANQVICPLDPAPDSRLWFYRLLGCDAVLSDDPGKTLRALGR